MPLAELISGSEVPMTAPTMRSHGAHLARSGGWQSAGCSLRKLMRFVSQVIICLWLNCSKVGGALASSEDKFPVEDFKSFINAKPTIESFVFAADAKRFASVADNGTVRHFTFKAEGSSIFSLFEDNSDEPENPFSTGFFWVRFGSQYWHRINSKDVFTTTWNEDDSFDHSYGPAAGVRIQFGLACDALNAGIIGLGTNGLEWDGLTFSGHSAETGYPIHGTLLLEESGRPLSMRVTYSASGHPAGFTYLVSYEFHPSHLIPKFFPSIIVVTSELEPPMLVALYRIEQLLLSTRKLGFADIDPNFYLSHDSRVFIQSNGIPFESVAMNGSHSFVPLGTFVGPQAADDSWGSPSTARILLGALVVGPLILTFLWQWRQHRLLKANLSYKRTTL